MLFHYCKAASNNCGNSSQELSSETVLQSNTNSEALNITHNKTDTSIKGNFQRDSCPTDIRDNFHGKESFKNMKKFHESI